MIDQANEAQLVGVGLDNRQMLHGVHFNRGWYLWHGSLLRSTLAAWRLHSSHGYGLLEAKMPLEKMRFIGSLRGRNMSSIVGYAS